jgi:hypothetical protein
VADETGRPVDELLAGSGIEPSVPPDVLRLRQPIAAHMRWDRFPDRVGVVTYQLIGPVPPPPPPPDQAVSMLRFNVCQNAGLLDLMGFGRTGADGSVILHLRSFVCWDDWKIWSEDQVWVVATPRSSDPVYLTHVVQTPPPNGPPPSPADIDMQIRVFTWDPGGQPKPNVFFTWRAVLHVTIPTDQPS